MTSSTYLNFQITYSNAFFRKNNPKYFLLHRSQFQDKSMANETHPKILTDDNQYVVTVIYGLGVTLESLQPVPDITI